MTGISGFMTGSSGLTCVVTLKLDCKLVMSGLRLGSLELMDVISLDRTELTSPMSSAERPATASWLEPNVDPLLTDFRSVVVVATPS